MRSFRFVLDVTKVFCLWRQTGQFHVVSLLQSQNAERPLFWLKKKTECYALCFSHSSGAPEERSESLEVPWQRPSLSRRQLTYLCLRKAWTLTFLVRQQKARLPNQVCSHSTGSSDCRWKSDSYASSAYVRC